MPNSTVPQTFMVACSTKLATLEVGSASYRFVSNKNSSQSNAKDRRSPRPCLFLLRNRAPVVCFCPQWLWGCSGVKCRAEC